MPSPLENLVGKDRAKVIRLRKAADLEELRQKLVQYVFQHRVADNPEDDITISVKKRELVDLHAAIASLLDPWSTL